MSNEQSPIASDAKYSIEVTTRKVLFWQMFFRLIISKIIIREQSVASRIKKVIFKWALFPVPSSLSLSKVLENINSANSFLYNIIRITGFPVWARVTVRSFNSSPSYVSSQK